MHFFGEVPRSGGLGLKTRRPPGRLCRALRIPFLGWDTGLAYASEYSIPSVKRSVNLRSFQADTEPGKLGPSSRENVGCKEKDPLQGCKPFTWPEFLKSGALLSGALRWGELR